MSEHRMQEWKDAAMRYAEATKEGAYDPHPAASWQDTIYTDKCDFALRNFLFSKEWEVAIDLLSRSGKRVILSDMIKNGITMVKFLNENGFQNEAWLPDSYDMFLDPKLRKPLFRRAMPLREVATFLASGYRKGVDPLKMIYDGLGKIATAVP